MRRRTFIIGTAGLIAVPVAATAEAGWSKPLAVRFEPGRADLSGTAWDDLQAAVKAFQGRANPRNGDYVRVVGYMDDAEWRKGLRDLPRQRAEAVAYEFGELDKAPRRARALRGSGLLVDVAGASAANRVALLSWRVSS